MNDYTSYSAFINNDKSHGEPCAHTGLGIRCDDQAINLDEAQYPRTWSDNNNVDQLLSADTFDINNVPDLGILDFPCTNSTNINDDTTIIEATDSFLAQDPGYFFSPESMHSTRILPKQNCSSRSLSSSPCRLDGPSWGYTKIIPPSPSKLESGGSGSSSDVNDSFIYYSVDSSCSPFDLPTPLSEPLDRFSGQAATTMYSPDQMANAATPDYRPRVYSHLPPKPTLQDHPTPHFPQISASSSSHHIPTPSSPLKQIKKRRHTEARISMAQLYDRMGLADDPTEAGRRESCIMELLRKAGFEIGHKTWIRDTDESTRTRIIQDIFISTYDEFGYDKDLLELIVRRSAYYQMQRRLRQIRKRKKDMAAAKQ